jgi:hypothetical protein
MVKNNTEKNEDHNIEFVGWKFIGYSCFVILLHIVYIITGAITLNESETIESSETDETKKAIEAIEISKKIEKIKKRKAGAIIYISISSIIIAAIILGIILEIKFRFKYSSTFLYSTIIFGNIFLFINVGVIINFSL